MALNDIPGYGLVEDGVLPIVGSNMNNFSKENLEDLIKEIISGGIETDLNIKETDDKLMVNGKEVLVDNFVRSGEYDGTKGNLELEIGEGRKVNISMPSAMDSAEVEKMFK